MLAVNTSTARLHIGLGIAQYSRGRHEEAVTSFGSAADLAPATGDGPDLARVEALLRKAMALDARHAKARVQLGILLSEQRRWPDAIQALRAAIALEPDLAQAHFRLAQAYRRTGQASLADRELAIFEKLKARQPAEAVPPVPE